VAGAALTMIGLPTPSAAQQATSSPLAQYPGFGHNPQADEARFEREDVARERRISQCMERAGLRYTPAPAVRNPPVTAAREGRDATRAIRVDRNETYARSLPPAERTQYYLALYGVPDPNSETGPLWSPRNPTGGGCVGDATRAIPGVYSARSALVREFLDLRLSIPRDPRVAVAEQRWSVCMRARGFNYASPRAVHAALDSAAGRGVLTPEIKERHQQANAAARTCGAESGLDATVAQVRADKEAEFVSAHKDVLDRHLERQRNEPPPQ
jgi:hypothetical protein